MPPKIDYVFTLLSPWAYLGFDAFHAVAKAHKASITYRPVMLGEVFSETGGLPLAKRHPARQAYRMMELQRWRAMRGLPLLLHPKGFPCDIALADCLALAIAEAGLSPEAYLRKAHRAIWAENRHLDDEATLLAILAQGGFNSSVLQIAKSEKITALYAQNRDWALKSGIFGAPSYVLNGEIFWGQDRISLLQDALETRRPPYSAFCD